MWHKDAFSFGSQVVGTGFIAVVGQHLKTNRQCIVVNVYAPCNQNEKVVLWDVLTTLKQQYHNMAWCFCGYFIAVRRDDERKGVRGCSRQRKEIDIFNCFIENNGLLDIPFVGKKYTWFKSNGTAKSRLDRILVSQEWLQIWPASKQYVQQRTVSDHCALVVKSLDKDWGPKPFRSFDAWFMEPNFLTMVKEKWKSYNVQGKQYVKLKDKLKLQKLDLKMWSRNTYGCLESNKKHIVKEIEELDGKDDNDALTGDGNMRRLELFSQLGLVDKKIDSMYRQKTRLNWLKYGDINSKFFHLAIRWRRLRNEVKGVEVDSQWCEEPEVVRREARLLFENRFKATHDYGVNMGSLEFKTLTLEVSRNMIACFSEEEVKEAIWQCEGAKSPDPDGFNFNFIKNCWDVMKSDIMEAMHSFHASGSFPKGC